VSCLYRLQKSSNCCNCQAFHAGTGLLWDHYLLGGSSLSPIPGFYLNTVHQGEPSRHLWVGNLDQSVATKKLWEVFSCAGEVQSVSRFKAHAFVDYVSLKAATKAHTYLQV